MKVEIRVSEQRLNDMVTVDEMIGLEDGKLRAIRDVLAKFVIGDDGKYLEVEEARKVVGQMTIAQLRDSAGEFTRLAENAAIPPENGAA